MNIAGQITGIKFTVRHPDTDLPLSFGKVYTYEPDSTIQKITWKDEDKNATNTNPVILDAAGQCNLFLDGPCKIVITDQNGVQIDTIDKARDAASTVREYVADLQAGYGQLTLDPTSVNTVAENIDAVLAAPGYASVATAQATIATNSATSATASASSALSSKNAAHTSEVNAASSASSASTSASNAATSESNALSYKNSASSSATTATTKASEASTSASNAATSATSASTSATSASGSASTATTKASAASSSATAAASSASSASTSATNASNSATAAATSATNAATSESNALSYKNSASTSASTATTQAGIATTKASEAASSASSASSSATSASTSATNANSSANSAANSASSTAALLATFRSVFLGAFTSDSAAVSFATANSITITDGIMYENTVSDKFRIYTGSAWQDYDSSAQASQSAAALSAANAASSAGSASASATSASDSATSASSSASSASASATSASGSATTATTQAGIATTKAGEASTSATSASNSATSSANSATLAQEWSSNPKDTVVAYGKYSAYHWALKAQEYAAGLASNISYDHTGTTLTSSNVQDAITELTTTAKITDSTDKRFVTDAQRTVLSNTSGTNTGDQDLSGLVPKTTTVNGHALSGNVTVTKGDVGLGNVDNTSDLNKPISTATQTALNSKANSATTISGYGITDAYTKTDIGTLSDFTTSLG